MGTFKALVIKTDESPVIKEFNTRTYLVDASVELDGGYVTQFGLTPNLSVMADEDGQPKGLPVNVEANRIVAEVAPLPIVALQGTVILAGGFKRGLPTDVTAEVLKSAGLCEGA